MSGEKDEWIQEVLSQWKWRRLSALRAVSKAQEVVDAFETFLEGYSKSDRMPLASEIRRAWNGEWDKFLSRMDSLKDEVTKRWKP